MSGPEYALFDCDQHFYETRDSFTRFIDPAFRKQAVRPVVREDGVEVVMIGDRPLTFLLGHDLYDHAGAPGMLKEKLLAMKKGGGDMQYGEIPMQPEWRDRDLRLASMDAQNVAGCLMFPNVAVVVEHFMKTPEQLYANLRAFNRWLDEDWGYAYKDRIFAPPLLSLRNLDMAIAELESVLAGGARCIAMKAGPAYGRNPADPYFDRFWELVNEAGVLVAFHLGEAGYNEMSSVHWGEPANPPNFEMSAWQWAHCYCDRPIMETLTAFIYANFFERFPRIQLISVEHGCEWVPYLLKRMDKMRGMGRGGPWIRGQLKERPSAIFKRHVKVTPFGEDDTEKVVSEIGTSECIVLGSDWPHPEGLKEPRDFLDSIGGLPATEQRAIMRETGLALLQSAGSA
ncbi:MAG: amidohydrolase family protein [Deltaproteobacteria bacterium]|jgi:predicted TIM-barrel fold metal-dependent hydrolase|nr:amidohydrolase family protein [Deltaproteobacteria bacterium]MBW2499167.1 amidohydrolase family protein [Deltaproteobacteria bacterium]